MAQSPAEQPASPSSTVKSAAASGLQDLLPADTEECIELYFELDVPSERDVFLRHFARREGPAVDDFLRLAMAQDPDEFVQLQAAAAVARRGGQDGLAHLFVVLDTSSDGDLLAEAIGLLSECSAGELAQRLQSIVRDDSRRPAARHLARSAMARLYAAEAADFFLQEYSRHQGAQLGAEALPDLVAACLATPSTLPAAMAALQTALDAARRAESTAQAEAAAAPQGQDQGATELLLDAVDLARERTEAIEEGLFALQLPTLEAI